MDTDKRIHPRFSPQGLKANITLQPPLPEKEITLDGTIIDMSYTGIKIKLDTAIKANFSRSHIKINFIMPESGIPVSIHGTIKHLNDQLEYGMQYSNQDSEKEVDDLMFECIKISDENIQRIITLAPM